MSRRRALTTPRDLLVATRSRDKLRELEAILARAGVRVLNLDTAGVPRSADEDLLEVHESFEANALAKARYYGRVSGGLRTVADDSGLEVEVLGGSPGVHSKRWAQATGDAATVDTANNRKLLTELLGQTQRSARFICVVAYADTAHELTCRGELGGRIVTAPRGTHGFGYDPLFEADDLPGRTLAEVSLDEKNAVSHRGRALAALAQALGSAVARGDR